jgi:hypothetical protein
VFVCLFCLKKQLFIFCLFACKQIVYSVTTPVPSVDDAIESKRMSEPNYEDNSVDDSVGISQSHLEENSTEESVQPKRTSEPAYEENTVIDTIVPKRSSLPDYEEPSINDVVEPKRSSEPDYEHNTGLDQTIRTSQSGYDVIEPKRTSEPDYESNPGNNDVIDVKQTSEPDYDMLKSDLDDVEPSPQQSTSSADLIAQAEETIATVRHADNEVATDLDESVITKTVCVLTGCVASISLIHRMVS